MGQPPGSQIRKGGIGNYEWRHERERPLKRTRWTNMYFDFKGCSSTTLPRWSTQIQYQAASMTRMGIATGSFSAGRGGRSARTSARRSDRACRGAGRPKSPVRSRSRSGCRAARDMDLGVPSAASSSAWYVREWASRASRAPVAKVGCAPRTAASSGAHIAIPARSHGTTAAPANG